MKAFWIKFIGTEREEKIVAKTMNQAKQIFADREWVPMSQYILARKASNIYEEF